jgi:hypothetical protein
MFTTSCTMAWCLIIMSNAVLGPATSSPGAATSTKELYQFATQAECNAAKDAWVPRLGVTTTSRYGDVTPQSATCVASK